MLVTAPHVFADGGLGRQPIAAFQANTGDLWFTGPGIGAVNTGLGMATGTSPSITTDDNGYEIAYQSSSRVLGHFGGSGSGLTGLGMDPGSSPSITTVVTDTGGGRSYQMAFEANTDDLWTAGAFGTANLRLGMLRGTSPSITGIDGINTGESDFGAGGYHIAFQANTGTLWTYGDNIKFPSNDASQTNSNTGLGMKKSSPSTTSVFPP